MFKNVMVYRLGTDALPELDAMDEALSQARFEACGASQELSMGWAAPRGEQHGALVESIAGQRILKFTVESKSVPANVVRRKADEEIARIEASTGRKPGKKETRDLREEAKRALLPQAFSKVSSVWVWLDAEQDLLILDAGSQSRADAVISALVEAVPGVAPRLYNTQRTPQSAMAQWLAEGEADGAFQIEQDNAWHVALIGDEQGRAVVGTKLRHRDEFAVVQKFGWVCPVDIDSDEPGGRFFSGRARRNKHEPRIEMA